MTSLTIAFRGIVFIAGAAVVLSTLTAIVKTFVLPRSANVFLSRIVFIALYWLFQLRTRRVRSYETRDQVMALYAPLALLSATVFWLVLIIAGYTMMLWALGVRPLAAAYNLSGSSLLTLGFANANGLAQKTLVFSEAVIGLGLVALLIAYLPTMYGAFSRRETAVTMLEVRAGSPPSAITWIDRAHRLGLLAELGEQFEEWEVWFSELEESHTSLSALVFFRSPRPGRSWVTAAGAVLDTAALMASVVDVPRDVRFDLSIRAGYLALRHIAGFFGIPYDPAPQPSDPISISREEFDAACAELERQGVPLKGDREQAFRDFAGWRVNYDTVLLALAALTLAPYAPWSSDRSLREQPKLFKQRPW